MKFPKFPFYLRPKGVPAASGGGEGGAVTSVNGGTGDVVITPANIGAISDAVLAAALLLKADAAATTAALALKATLLSPTFTGTPLAPTAAGATNNTQLATTAFVKAAIDALIGGAPGALDTLNELALSLASDASFAATMVTALATKQNVTPASTWALRGVGSTVGQSKLITDIGGAAGTLVRWDGTYWRVTAPTYIVYDLTLQTGPSNTTENIIKTAVLPIGILRLGRSFRIQCLFAKNGVATAATTNLRLGTLGTIVDPLLFTSALFVASNRTFAVGPFFAVTSATQVRMLGRSDGIAGFTGGLSATPTPVNTTIEDIDVNALSLTASTQTGSGANLGQVAHLLVEMLP